MLKSTLRSRCIALALWASFFLGAVFILWPGLFGAFYLDDFPNLSPLANLGQHEKPYLSYILNPAVSGAGRPISYLTFLFQADSWPESPFDFKLVNLALHLLNGALVAALAMYIYSIVNEKRYFSLYIVCLGALSGFVWIILPIQSSTVFYVVQRMTILSAFFVLVSILGFTYLRYRYLSWSRREYFKAAIFCIFGYLGVFAKENAILVGVLIWVLDLAIIRQKRFKLNWSFSFVFLGLPALLVFSYLLFFKGVSAGYASRDFTLSERLLTQPVILIDYLSKIVFPTPGRLNLFNDGCPLYSSLAHSWQPVLAIASLVGLVLVAFKSRGRWPLFAFSVLFYLAGHLLESTFLPLEMYFEHRNYLPSAGIVIAVVYGMSVTVSKLRIFNRRLSLLVLLLGVCWVAMQVAVSAVEARTWGSPKKFAVAAYTERPNSLRAKQEMATYLAASGSYLQASNLLYSIGEKFVDYPGTYAQILLISCYDSRVPLPRIQKLKTIFKTGQYDKGVDVALNDIWRLKRKKGALCNSVSWDMLSKVLGWLNQNPAFERSANIDLLQAFVLADQGQLSEAIDVIAALPKRRRDFDTELLLVRFYLLDGKRKEAEQLLSAMRDERDGLNYLIYKKYIDRILSGDGSWGDDAAH